LLNEIITAKPENVLITFVIEERPSSHMQNCFTLS